MPCNGCPTNHAMPSLSYFIMSCLSCDIPSIVICVCSVIPALPTPSLMLCHVMPVFSYIFGHVRPVTPHLSYLACTALSVSYCLALTVMSVLSFHPSYIQKYLSSRQPFHVYLSLACTVPIMSLLSPALSGDVCLVTAYGICFFHQCIRIGHANCSPSAKWSTLRG